MTASFLKAQAICVVAAQSPQLKELTDPVRHEDHMIEVCKKAHQRLFLSKDTANLIMAESWWPCFIVVLLNQFYSFPWCHVLKQHSWEKRIPFSRSLSWLEESKKSVTSQYISQVQRIVSSVLKYVSSSSLRLEAFSVGQDALKTALFLLLLLKWTKWTDIDVLNVFFFLNLMIKFTF